MRKNIENLMKLAVDTLNEKQYESAILYANRAVMIAGQNLGNKDKLTLDSLELLADCYRKSNQMEESIALEEKVVNLRQEILQKDDPVLLTSMQLLAEDYFVSYQWNKARSLLQNIYITASESYGQGSELSQRAAVTLSYLESLDSNHLEALRVLKDTKEAAGEFCSQKLATQLENVQKEMSEHTEYYSLSENARNYAYTCAELDELIRNMNPEYQSKIAAEEIDYYHAQAKAVTCYKPHLVSKALSMRFETMGMWSLLQYKYLSPFLLEKHLLQDGIALRALITWIENHLCLIVTAISRGKPADYVKDLQKSSVEDLEISIGKDSIVVTMDDMQLLLKYNKEEGYLFE
jgi:hypothetical protein